MIRVTQIAALWLAALKDDPALNAWSQTRFGRLPRLYNPTPLRDLPGPKDCPFVGILPLEGDAGREAEELEFVLRLDLGLAAGRPQRTDERIWTSPELEILEGEFAPLVLDALERASDQVVLGGARKELFTESEGLAELGLTITVRVPTLVGAELDI